MNDNQNQLDNAQNPENLPPSGEQTEDNQNLNLPDNDSGDDSQDNPRKKSAEARINQLLAQNKALSRQLEERTVATPMPPTQPTAEPNPEFERASKVLKEMGFVHKNDLEERERAIKDRMALDSEHQRLENSYNGADGKPQYSRLEIEEFMRKNGIYNPEAAYKLMNESELTDWTIRHADEQKKRKPLVQRSGSTTGRDENVISREKLTDSLKTPEGRAWYEKNREKILDAMQKGQL